MLSFKYRPKGGRDLIPSKKIEITLYSKEDCKNEWDTPELQEILYILAERLYGYNPL